MNFLMDIYNYNNTNNYFRMLSDGGTMYLYDDGAFSLSNWDAVLNKNRFVITVNQKNVIGGTDPETNYHRVNSDAYKTNRIGSGSIEIEGNSIDADSADLYIGMGNARHDGSNEIQDVKFDTNMVFGSELWLRNGLISFKGEGWGNQLRWLVQDPNDDKHKIAHLIIQSAEGQLVMRAGWDKAVGEPEFVINGDLEITGTFNGSLNGVADDMECEHCVWGASVWEHSLILDSVVAFGWANSNDINYCINAMDGSPTVGSHMACNQMCFRICRENGHSELGQIRGYANGIAICRCLK